VDDFIKALHEMDSRLNVGLSYASYSDRLGDISVAYDASLASLKGPDALQCLTDVAVPAEAALNHYLAAQRRWSRCIDDIGCDVDSIDGALQSRWQRAGRQIVHADDGLAGLRSP